MTRGGVGLRNCNYLEDLTVGGLIFIRVIKEFMFWAHASVSDPQLSFINGHFAAADAAAAVVGLGSCDLRRPTGIRKGLNGPFKVPDV